MPLNRPTQIELLDAVESYLLHPSEDPKADAFYRRVASNTLAIVVRELQLAEEFSATEQALLTELLQQPEDQENLNIMLSDKILNQEIIFDSKLTSTLLTLSKKKLAIDNPRYLSSGE